jgi:hypothetical protein
MYLAYMGAPVTRIYHDYCVYQGENAQARRVVTITIDSEQASRLDSECGGVRGVSCYICLDRHPGR